MNLNFDTGVKEYEVNGGRAVFRLNPSDQNLYSRFFKATDEIRSLEQEWKSETGSDEDVLNGLEQLDSRVKAILLNVFPNNDFNQIFDGVNVLAIASNGKAVIENFFAAIEPIIREGAEQHRKKLMKAARQKAKQVKPEK